MKGNCTTLGYNFFVSFNYFIDFSILTVKFIWTVSQKVISMVALNSIFNPTLLSRAILGNKQKQKPLLWTVKMASVGALFNLGLELLPPLSHKKFFTSDLLEASQQTLPYASSSRDHASVTLWVMS